VLAENQKPGTTSWQISGAQTATGILGYTDMVQAQVGQRVTLYVSTEAPAFKVEAFRMGYYHGRGARLYGGRRSLRKPASHLSVTPASTWCSAPGRRRSRSWLPSSGPR